MIPLAAVSHYRPGHTPLSINHQGLFVASTISFNLQPGKSLGQAADEINAAIAQIDMPSSVTGVLAGTAQLFQQSLSKEPILILTAIAAVYILLGVLYESYVHPITILSTLPSAGVGAILALIAVSHRVRHHRTDRRHPSDRHRQKERHHDGRFRHRGEAIAGTEPLRRDLRGLHAALSPDHDDDVGRHPWRRAAGAELRQRRRNPPPARHLRSSADCSSARC